MIRYVGCDQARELLDGFVDGELAVDEQVVVESHLRWCRTCALRVEDMQLIGRALRVGGPAFAGEDPQGLSAISRGVLLRVRAERDQSLGSQVRELFVDMRLLWPALGATMAVVIGVAVTTATLHSATVVDPESLAAIIDRAAQASRPGSASRPMLPDNNVSIPRLMDDGSDFATMSGDDGVIAVATVVTSDGRIADYQLLMSGERTNDVEMVLDAIRQSRLTPARSAAADGQPVAVNMVWLFATAKAVKEPPLVLDAKPARAPQPRRTVVTPPAADQPLPERQSARRPHSTIA